VFLNLKNKNAFVRFAAGGFFFFGAPPPRSQMGVTYCLNMAISEQFSQKSFLYVCMSHTATGSKNLLLLLQ